MFTLILGASASGKSEFGENLCLKLAKGKPKLYIATMQPFGEDAKYRIERHQKLRANKGFSTLEKYTNLQEFCEKKYHTVLLECMSNLLANEFFTGENYEQNILLGIDKILENSENLVLISNNVFSDGINYDEETMKYTYALGKLNQVLAQKADNVIEVVCSIPINLKGDKNLWTY